jgi:type I restriction enzyme M protein
VLFIDARKLGTLVDRTHRELTEDDIARVAGTYHAWRGDPDVGAYADVPGFARTVTIEEIAEHGYVLTPGRFVGAEDAEDDEETFEEKAARLSTAFLEQAGTGAELTNRIEHHLEALGYGR